MRFKGVIISFLLSYYLPSFTQELIHSRKFDALKKNVPLVILNNHADHFYVLRYSKLGHDLAVEKRAKPTAEIISFTPLKLDSINASWFDYEKLNYLFFEKNLHTYFLFEKELNFKKKIYLKIVDSAGKASGFLELASLDKDNVTLRFNFELKLTQENNILIIASKTSINGRTRKVAMLFDVQEKRTKWAKKLPLENAYYNSSSEFECNSASDLFYIYNKSNGSTYMQESFYPALDASDSLFVVSWKANTPSPEYKFFNADNVNEFKNTAIISAPQKPIAFIQGVMVSETSNLKEIFLTYRIDSATAYPNYKIMDDNIKDQLTFYDGPEKESYLKYHRTIKKLISDSLVDIFFQRSEGYFSKEILCLRIDIATGRIIDQKIIPHKVFFFKERTRFKSLGEVMFSRYQNESRIITLEHPSNLKQEASKFRYHGFRKETNVWGANVVMYSLKDNGELHKQLIYHNSDFDLVPLKYESCYTGDIVFYLNSGKYEKFAFLK